MFFFIIYCFFFFLLYCFFFQAEDGIRDLVRSRGLGDVYKRQTLIANFPGWLQTLSVLGAVAFIIFAGRTLVRPLLRFVAATRLRELFTATALLLVVGITVLMTLVGLSPALGTFLAGVVLANSEYRHELESDIEPFKGLLLGLFFIAVGASINFRLIIENPLLIAGLVIAIPVSYTHLRAHETVLDLVCRLLLEKKKTKIKTKKKKTTTTQEYNKHYKKQTEQ